MRPPGLIACAYSWPIAWVRPGKLSRSRARDWSRLPDSNRRIKGFTALCPTTELRRHRSGIAAGRLEPYTHDRLPRLLVPYGMVERRFYDECLTLSGFPCGFRHYHYSISEPDIPGHLLLYGLTFLGKCAIRMLRASFCGFFGPWFSRLISLRWRAVVLFCR